MTSVAFHSVSKSYPIYDSPVDRLKELLTFHRSRRHQVFWALRDVSFEAAKGSTFCVIGENGSGKSTSLQLVAGIFAPTEGQVEVNGRVSALLELGAGFNPEFSGRDNVFLSAAIHGLSTKQIAQRFPDIEQFAEIGEFIEQPVKTYSSGMLVRLAFAVAIHVDPDILLVDEALAVGDYYFRQRCMRKVQELRQREVTILFVSHSMADVKAIGSARAVARERPHGRARQARRGCTKISRPHGREGRRVPQAQGRRRGPPRRAGASGGRARDRRDDPQRRLPARQPGGGDHRHRGARRRRPPGAPDRAAPPADAFVSACARAGRSTNPTSVSCCATIWGWTSPAPTRRAKGSLCRRWPPGDIFTVDFHLDIPELYPGNFSFSPAIANGSLEAYEMCDWIDNALTLPMARGDGAVYGYIHLPCRIDINTPLSKAPAAPPPVSSWKG